MSRKQRNWFLCVQHLESRISYAILIWFLEERTGEMEFIPHLVTIYSLIHKLEYINNILEHNVGKRIGANDFILNIILFSRRDKRFMYSGIDIRDTR